MSSTTETPTLSRLNLILLPVWLILANSLLAFAPLDAKTRGILILLVLVVPLLIVLRIPKKFANIPSLSREEWFSPTPAWWMSLLFFAAVAVRFYRLTSLTNWPLEDEALNGHYAVELAEHGVWKMTYDFSGMPPFYVWGLGLFFKAFGVSLTTLWLFPSLLSCFGILFAWLGARKFFSRSFSLLFACLMAFSFWPLYAGRLSLEGGLLLNWECLVFYLWGTFEKSPVQYRVRSALVLGIGSGLGFYTFPSWAVAAFLLTLVLLKETIFSPRREWKTFIYFFLPQAFFFLILTLATLPQKSGHYANVLQIPWGPGFPGLNDFFTLFWGSRLPWDILAYRPFWGGFLNPVLGGLCFWGAASYLKRRGLKAGLIAFMVFSLLMLPGFLTGGLDSHRIIQVLPFLLIASAYGLCSLLEAFPKSSRAWVAAVVIFISAILDYHHLFCVIGDYWKQPRGLWFASKSVERWRAYEILRDLNREEGPGFVLSELVPDTFDQTLSVIDYPFNACENDKIIPGSCRWAALLANIHYQPYLQGQFPEAKWFWLASDVGRPDGGIMLGLIPLPSSHPGMINRWIAADRQVHGLAGAVYDNHDWKPRAPVIEALFQRFGYFKDDPFLESCFFEKIAENDYKDRLFGPQLEAIRQALDRGIPAAHLFNALGSLYLRRGNLREARNAFEKALRCKPNHTSASEGLKLLDQMEKTGKPPMGVL